MFADYFAPFYSWTEGQLREKKVAPPCQRVTFEKLDYHVCKVDLHKARLKMFWKRIDGQPYGSLFRFIQDSPKHQMPLLFAMNAGMFQADSTPVGLYIENGRQQVGLNTSNGKGNFFMKPNGVFYIERGRANIVPTKGYMRKKPFPEFATQSGPMLLINGKIHPRLAPDGPSRKIRNAVGTIDGAQVLFVISRQTVSFGKLARFFQKQLGCKVALYLDGEISSFYSPSFIQGHPFLPAGPIVAAFPRAKQKEFKILQEIATLGEE